MSFVYLEIERGIGDLLQVDFRTPFDCCAHTDDTKYVSETTVRQKMMIMTQYPKCACVELIKRCGTLLHLLSTFRSPR